MVYRISKMDKDFWPKPSVYFIVSAFIFLVEFTLLELVGIFYGNLTNTFSVFYNANKVAFYFFVLIVNGVIVHFLFFYNSKYDIIMKKYSSLTEKETKRKNLRLKILVYSTFILFVIFKNIGDRIVE